MAYETQLKAVAQCDREDGNRGCVITQSISRDAESMTLSQFNEYARKEFESRGWTFYGSVKCPRCSRL